MFPSKYEDQDCNKLSLICFCLEGLELLGGLSFSDVERVQFIDFIYNSYYVNNGFRDTMNPSGDYDIPTVASTFFGLSNLVMLKDPINAKIDRSNIMQFLQQCQIKEGEHKGSFSPTLNIDGSNYGETDLRICYMAVGIRRILNYNKVPIEQRKYDIDEKGVIDYILKRLNYDGGFSCLESSESHLGYTFCAIATLKLLNFDFNTINTNNTKDWIVHRQINYPEALYDETAVNHQEFGAFNGRENKPGDACYSWWSLGSLDLIDNLQLANLQAASDYLLLNQEHRIGGIAKNFDSSPDPYHSFLAICSLSLIKDHVNFNGKESIKPIDPLLTIPLSLLNFIDSLEWEISQ